MTFSHQTIVLGIVATCVTFASASTSAAEVTVKLKYGDGVTFVGAFNRWDIDGNHRKPVNPKAKIDTPEVDAVAKDEGDGRWVFSDLEPGRYDLVIMADGKRRIEGWHYTSILDFDPIFPPDATTDDSARSSIDKDIRAARHYENKVVPLYMGGDKSAARILVMLIRDERTSYEGQLKGAATMRFELWQYDWKYGGWVKNKRTKVMHRVMTTRDNLKSWTWLWEPKLGGLEVKTSPVTVEYALPTSSDTKLKGLRPY